jgi:short-subunit dehydrogenase
MKDFHEKVIWITGASSGIGEALAHTFAREGARLVLSARREGELQRVKIELGVPNERVLVLPMDLTEIDTFEQKVAEVLDRFGQIDVVVQNAGVSQRALATESPLSVDRALMEVNYFGVVALTKAVLPHLLSRKTGLFVPISSLAGHTATPMRSGYAASKFAVRGFFDALRAEIWRDGLWVTTICPGYIRTAISVNALGPGGQPHRRMDDNQAHGMPADVCAEKILKAIRLRKREAYIGGLREVGGAYLKRYAPGLLWRLIRNYGISSKPVTSDQ